MNQEQTQQFEAFWKCYPRRVGKGTARKAFEKALKLASAEEIIAGLHRQLAYYSTRETQFIPHPSTWLNGERWGDDPQPVANQNTRRSLIDAARDLNGHYVNADWFGDSARLGPGRSH